MTCIRTQIPVFDQRAGSSPYMVQGPGRALVACGIVVLALLLMAGCGAGGDDDGEDDAGADRSAAATTVATDTDSSDGGGVEPAVSDEPRDAASSAPTPAPRRRCPNIGEGGFGVINIYVQGTDCATASAVMDANRGRDAWTSRGFRCREIAEYRQPGYEDAGHTDYRCTGSNRRTIAFRFTYY